ncbi:hypothetical protein ACJX0J_041836, partial [Zea mays]
CRFIFCKLNHFHQIPLLKTRLAKTKLNPLQSNQLEYKGSYKFAYSKTKKIFGQLELDSKHISFMILDNQGQAITCKFAHKKQELHPDKNL